jgi:hypothetical protein
MKKYILALIAMMTFNFANAQDAEFGVKAGVDLASIHIILVEVFQERVPILVFM